MVTAKSILNQLRATIRRAFRARFALFLTIEGWCMVSAMLLIGLAALNTAAPLLYLMFSMMCAFFVLSALMATNTIRSLDISRTLPSAWVARQPLRVELRLTNHKRLSSSYSLRARDYLLDGDTAGAAFFDRVPPGGKPAVQIYELMFLRRGVYRFETLEVATRFPFGLIERRLFFRSPFEVLVLPQTISIGEAMKAAQTQLGEYSVNVKGSGAGLYGLRPYTPELPSRDIHWKVSARRGSLIAREYESEERRRACVILDNRAPANLDAAAQEVFEQGIVLAASALEWLTLHGHEVELRTASGMIGFGTGAAHLTRCRRALAGLKIVSGDGAARHLLANPDPSVVSFPILLHGNAASGPALVPLCVEQYAASLQQALQPPPAGPSVPAVPQMF